MGGEGEEEEGQEEWGCVGAEASRGGHGDVVVSSLGNAERVRSDGDEL